MSKRNKKRSAVKKKLRKQRQEDAANNLKIERLKMQREQALANSQNVVADPD